MSKLVSHFLLFALVSVSFSRAQTNNLVWSDDAKLSWSDFRSQSTAKGAFSFLSDLDFTYKVVMQGYGKAVDVEVICYFNRDSSFAGDSIRSDDLLRREQLRFDITEKFARMYRKELQSQKWERKTFQREFDKLYNKLALEGRNEHRDCVREIKREEDKLGEWEKNISKDLRKLNKYSETKFVVYFR